MQDETASGSSYNNLASVTLADGFKEIGPFAFCNCTHLTNVIIPDSVESISAFAFDGCPIVDKMTIPGVCLVDGWAVSKNWETDPRGDIDLMGIRGIGTGAFWYSDNLTSVTIPDNVASIGQQAFDGCGSLTNVTIGCGVREIASWAFSDCPNLASVVFRGNAPLVFDAFDKASSNCVIYVRRDSTGWNTDIPGTWHGMRIEYLQEGEQKPMEVVIPQPESDTSIVVPFSFIDEKATAILAAHAGDYEAAAYATAANGVNKVWECYVAGLVPTNATDVFRAVISMEDGKPVIRWTPDLNEGGTKQERVYTVEGRASLTEGDWEELKIENGELKIGECRFFRVSVTLP